MTTVPVSPRAARLALSKNLTVTFGYWVAPCFSGASDNDVLARSSTHYDLSRRMPELEHADAVSLDLVRQSDNSWDAPREPFLADLYDDPRP